MIYEKLNMIQSKMKAPKNLYNSFGKYKYRNAESILEAFKPYGRELGVVLMISDSVEQIGDRTYIKATATLYDIEDKTFVQTSAYARESATKKGMDDSQVTGATSSYARKYCLNGLFLLDDTKDSDTDEFKTEAENRQKQSRDKSLRVVLTLCNKHGVDFETWVRQNGKESADELTAEDIGKMLKVLQDRFVA